MASFFFVSSTRTSTFCALRQLMHIYQFLPYVLSTSFSTHPKRLTWDKKRPPPFYIFRHYATYRKLRKKNQKNLETFFSIFSFLRAFVVSSCRKSGFRVFFSLIYGADLGRSRLVHLMSSLNSRWASVWTPKFCRAFCTVIFHTLIGVIKISPTRIL